MATHTPTESDSPKVGKAPVKVRRFNFAPAPEKKHAVQNLFQAPKDPSWTADPAKDMPNLPLPDGYDPEAERRRRQYVGYRYHPPGAPIKPMQMREVEWADFLTLLE
jgi:hypothetical protein